MDYCAQISKKLKGKTITDAWVDGSTVQLKLDNNTKFSYNATDGGYSTFSISEMDTFEEELNELTSERPSYKITVKELKNILDGYPDDTVAELELSTTEYGSAGLVVKNNYILTIEC